MDLSAKGKPKEASFEIKVIRADGTVEDYGTVSYWHRNPLKRWQFAAKQNPRKTAAIVGAVGTVAALALYVRSRMA